jgi:hypothetical protein
MCLDAPEDKSDSPITCALTTKVPDRDGVRFCRVCQEFKPVSIFPAGPRRFVCRTHFWERHGKIRKLLLFTNPRKRAVICLWKRLYEDSRTLGLSLALTQAEVAEMLETLEENDHRGLSPSDVAIMPRDLAAPVSRENAAFVHKKTRRALLSKFKQARKRCGREIKPESWKLFLASVAL